jgi:hypothetical protein
MERPVFIFFKTIALIMLLTIAAFSDVDINYDHNVVGTGTVVTDYRIGDQENSMASGAIRGTGNVVNNYAFSTNNSSNLKVEDRLVLTKTLDKAVTMAIAPSLPSWPKGDDNYRLIGEAWAEKIELPPKNPIY